MARLIFIKSELFAWTSITGNESQSFHNWVKFVSRTNLWNIIVSITYTVQHSEAQCMANIMHINAQCILTFWWQTWAFQFWCTVYVKCEHMMNQKDNIMKYMAFCKRQKRDYAACLKKYSAYIFWLNI